MKRIIVIALAACALAGCGHAQPSGDIAIVDIARITANWPKFINYNNQITADAQSIERTSASPQQKQRQRAALQQRYAKLQGEVTDDVRNAAAQIAKEKNYKMVFTREFVGYGGTDITPDVEKALKITETASPTP